MLSIDSWAAGGRGVGRVDGRVWMVAGAVPGDRIAATPTKVHERYVEAVAERMVERSTLRREAPCPIQAACGGCPLMPVDEPEQRAAKHRFVVDALRRIGRMPGPLPVDDIVAAPPFLGYRNRIELSLGRGPDGPVLGYHRAQRPAELEDVQACAIADPRLQPLLRAARAFFLDGPGATDPVFDGQAGDARLVLRASATKDERLIALRGPQGTFLSAPEFAHTAADADPGLAGVVRLITTSGRRGGAAVVTIAGRGWIAEEVHGIAFRVPAATFLQVHPRAAELIARSFVETASRPRDVLELYGGIGALGLSLARAGARVTIVDADPAAVACGAEAAEAAGLTARFERDDVLAFLRSRREEAPPDMVIADPPRTGLGRGVAARLSALAAPAIAMVSCEPATLARDLAELLAGGYAIERMTPFDLFPQTAHVETVTWLKRRG